MSSRSRPKLSAAESRAQDGCATSPSQVSPAPTQDRWTVLHHDPHRESLKGCVPESWCCVDCGRNTAPGCLTRKEAELAYTFHEKVENLFTADTEVYTVTNVRDWLAARTAALRQQRPPLTRHRCWQLAQSEWLRLRQQQCRAERQQRRARNQVLLFPPVKPTDKPQ